MPRSVALYALLVCACAVTAVLAADGPLRIKEFYDDLPLSANAGDTPPYCKTTSNTVKDRKSGGIVQCTADDMMNDAKINELKKAVTAAITMHGKYLRVVTPSAANGITFPTQDGKCTHFSISDTQKKQLITEADFALYVAASPMSPDMQAWGTWCGPTTTPTARPEAGAVNIVPKHIPASSTALTRLVAREILVGLGFSLNVFNKDGSVTTIDVRDKTGVPAAKGTKVLAAAQKHFGCDSMAGVELEYVDEASKTPLPYWRGRVMKDDLMAPNQTAGYYTAITIAAMVDTGYYAADTTATAEDMPWGRNAGCDFIGKKCIDSDGKAIGDMFCTGDTTDLSCTTDRLALGTCGILSEITGLPNIYKYFAGTTKGGAQVSMDYCPVVAPADTKTHCITGSDIPYSVFGESARCLDVQDSTLTYDTKQMHGVCANIQCNAADGTYTVQVKDATTAVSCPADTTVNVDFGTGNDKKTAKLHCPKYADACPMSPAKPKADSTPGSKSNSKAKSSSDSRSSHPSPPNDGAVMTATRSMSWVAACLVAVLLACV